MEERFTLEEILCNTTMGNTKKIELLYLQHDKNYKEISELLGLKESTVRYNVSSGGYCRRKPGERDQIYGDIRAVVREKFSENPSTDPSDICRETGCSISLVRKYMKEMGIVRSKCPRKRQTGPSKPRKPKETPVKNEEPVASVLSTESYEQTEDLISENFDSGVMEENTKCEEEQKMEKPVISDTEPSSEDSEKTSDNSAITDTYSEQESGTNPDRKPYVVMDWPYVIYNGSVYEVLDRHTLRVLLYKTLKIKRRRKSSTFR